MPSRPLESPHVSSAFALTLLVAACSPSAVAGEDAAAAAPAAEPEPVAITQYTAGMQLYLEYPRLVVDEEARFLVHLTVLDDGRPVRSGAVRLEIGPEGNPRWTFDADRPTRDGLFIPAGALTETGGFSASLYVQSDQGQARFELPNFQVHPDGAAALSASEEEAAAAPVLADLVPFLLEQQWEVGTRLEAIGRRSLTGRLPAVAFITARPESEARLGAPVAGTLHGPDGGPLPRYGSEVEAGQVLGYVEASLTASDLVQLEAARTDLLAREMEMEAKLVEVRQAQQEAAVALEFAESAAERMAAMRAEGLGTEAAWESTQRDLRHAEASMAGAAALEASFTSTHARLRQSRQALGDGTGSGEGLRYPLVAPIDGELIEVEALAGSAVAAQQPLFRILDLDRVWVEAEVSEFDIGRLQEPPDGHLRSSLFPDSTFRLREDLDGSLVHAGHHVDPETRTVHMVFEVHNPEHRLPVGHTTEVLLATRTSREALAIPEDAVVRDLGRDVVFIAVGGETMQRREVRLGIRDEGWVEVLSGLEEGDRVVVEQAYRVKLASVAPAEMGHGHAH